jgi:hypothetical protein
MLACAFLLASACGVAVIVTALGLGGWLGAVYVALSAIAFPPVACVVTVLNVPHVEPEHPGPESIHVSTPFGLEPGAGVSVATIVADPPAGKLAGAASCNVNWLVMLMFAELCFDGSATLCAVRVTLGAVGRIPGAV